MTDHIEQASTDFELTQDKTLSGITTAALREAIIQGDIAAGEKLNEPSLAQKFNVSRGPLREAIRRLVGLRLVEHVPHVGARVITIDLPRIIELYEVREALEGKAAALAAQNMSDDDIGQLAKILDLHSEHLERSKGEYLQEQGDVDFHYQIIKGCGNHLLTHQLCNELYHLIRMFRVQSSRIESRPDQALREHTQLFYAIEQRDSQLAEILIRKHIDRAKKSIIETFDNKANRTN